MSQKGGNNFRRRSLTTGNNLEVPRTQIRPEDSEDSQSHTATDVKKQKEDDARLRLQQVLDGEDDGAIHSLANAREMAAGSRAKKMTTAA